MIQTYGLSHIALAVSDPRRSAGFYRQVFGCELGHESESTVELHTPGSHDVITLEKAAASVGETRGIGHFGFRLVRPEDIDSAVEAVVDAGGTVDLRGEFAPGFPFAFVRDLDGYEVEIWFE